MLEDKLKRERRLRGRLTENREAIAVLWVLLILQALVLLILHPGFIPVDWLSWALEALQDFFCRILWPVGEADFADKTYRSYIYKAVTWVKGWPGYPILVMVSRYGLLVLLCILYAYRVIASLVLYAWEHDVGEKKPAKKKEISVGPKPAKPLRGKVVSGMLDSKAAEANHQLRAMQKKHPELPKEDMGLWIGNKAKTDRDDKRGDEILHWDADRITYDTGVRGKLEFKLENKRAYLRRDGSWEALEVGVPVAICYQKRTKEIAFTVTWLGGF